LYWVRERRSGDGALKKSGFAYSSSELCATFKHRQETLPAGYRPSADALHALLAFFLLLKELALAAEISPP
jgi:hypothetical protein